MDSKSIRTHSTERYPDVPIGTRYGRWTVIGPPQKNPDPSRRVARWVPCRCDCGTERLRKHHYMAGQYGGTSCGCVTAEKSAARHLTHGKADTPEHKAWSGIKRRCFAPADRSYKNYGGRGITMCDRWRESFEAFLGDVGPRPSPKHSLERIDNDGPYSPENCRWATRHEQSRNTRRNRYLTACGETLTMADWARRRGVDITVIRGRLARGWSVERAVMSPLSTRGRRRSTGAIARAASELL